MSEITPEKLFKKIELSSNVKLISDFFSQSKIKVSKQIYKEVTFEVSLETRNIKLFIKQQKEMEEKRKEENPLPKKSLNQKGRYDENQLLEMEYKIKKSQEKPVYIERCQTQPSEITSNSDRKYQKVKQSSKITTSKNLEALETSKIFINRPKRVTYIQPIPLNRSTTDNAPENLPRITIRKKSKSTFEELDKKFRINEIDIGSKLRLTNMSESEESLLKKSSSSIMEFSNKMISKKRHNLSTINEANDKLVEITDDKMTRYIKSFHILVNGSYEYGRSLDEEKVNSLIVERYTLSRKAKISSEKDEKEPTNKKFQFPYLEFISEAETRKSIHRIINMSVKNTQRVVFKLLDINRNGVIDEKDIVDLIELSEKIPDLKPDLLKIVQFACKSEKFSISNANSMSYREESQRQLEKLEDIPERYEPNKTPKKENRLNPASISKNSYLRERTNTFESSEFTELVSPRKFHKKDSSFGSSSFNKERLYSFFETKNKFFNLNKNKGEFRFTVNLQDFYKIFENQRPSTFNDLIKYLFNVRQEESLHYMVIDQSHSDSKLSKKSAKTKTEEKEGFKNYNVPEMIKDIEKKFECNIEMSKYEDVLHIEKISETNKRKD